MIIRRHKAREARRHEGTEARSEATSRRRGFSLIEVLLSVFILSIGVISIAALFPAGIAQQRQSVDDITGPIVAQNALAILRTKLRPADFGTFEEFGAGPPLFTIDGDWPWLRPAFIFNDPGFSSGTIDIFNGTEAAGSSEPGIPSGIPYNTARHGGLASPIFIVTQQERYYPMRSLNSADPRPPRPQYVWDCMFRRFQGKVMVAIFVYRTTIVGGGDVAYSVPVNPSPFDPDEPPMPWSLDITTSQVWADEGPWNADGDQFINGTRAGEPYDTTERPQSWQEPGQWILDQNNNLHRVLSQNRASVDDTAVEVELVRPVSQMLPLPVYFFLGTAQDSDGDGFMDQKIVSNIWYIPREVKLDTNDDGEGDLPVRLTPVYVTVREL